MPILGRVSSNDNGIRNDRISSHTIWSLISINIFFKLNCTQCFAYISITGEHNLIAWWIKALLVQPGHLLHTEVAALVGICSPSSQWTPWWHAGGGTGRMAVEVNPWCLMDLHFLRSRNVWVQMPHTHEFYLWEKQVSKKGYSWGWLLRHFVQNKQ